MEKEDKGTLKLGGTKLILGDVRGGRVPQSLSHGRTRSVTVEVKKRRVVKKEEDGTISDSASFKHQIDQALSSLTVGERENRLKVLKQAAEDEKRFKEEMQIKKLQQEEEEKLAAEQALLEAEKFKEQEKIKALAKATAKIEETTSEEGSVKAKETSLASDTVKNTVDAKSDANSSNSIKPIKTSERLGTSTISTTSSILKKIKDQDEEPTEEAYVKPKKVEEKRRSNKITIAQALSGDIEERVRSLASVRRAREKARRLAGLNNKEKEKIVREVILPEVITVQELSNRMAERVYDVTKVLMRLGMMVTANQSIDADTAELIIAEFGHTVKRVTEADVENILAHDEAGDEGNLIKRAPVVTFMGHVDHGKTSLLDAIRKTQVASGESGGITQHIGAYQVKTDSGEKITFLDTPGHEAFTAMRQRGANATDIVVLVVAADDGIMAQTVEAINHAKAAGVPIIVAINKIDKQGADPQAVRNALLTYELVTEDMGGDVLYAEVSAKQGLNIDRLLELILLQSEVLELKANPNSKASGIVVEAKVDKGKGIVATVLVQKGTLKIGDLIVAGEAYGRIRAMMDASGLSLDQAGPSVPVEILGLDLAPEAGVHFSTTVTDKQAREIVEYRKRRSRDIKSAAVRKTSLEDLFEQAGEGGIKELPVVIKGDVQGSIEAIIASLAKLANEEVKIRVLHNGVGAITGSDVTLANASHAVVLGFHVRSDNLAKELAQRDNVDIRYYSVIYDLINDMKAILSGMLKPIIREQYLGNAEVREVFSSGKKIGKVAGCFVIDGKIERGASVRLLRDNIVVYEGKLKTLRRFKDDVKEVGLNFECGIAFEGFDDFKKGDLVEAFNLVEESRTL